MTRGLLWIGWSSKDPINEVTCDLNGKVGQSCAGMREEHFRERNSKCKGPGAGMDLTYSRRRNKRDCRGTMEEVRSKREAGTKKTPFPGSLASTASQAHHVKCGAACNRHFGV